MCVSEIILARRHVEDEGPEARTEVAGQFIADPVIAADEIGAEGLVVLEWDQPVGIDLGLALLGEL